MHNTDLRASLKLAVKNVNWPTDKIAEFLKKYIAEF